MTRSNLETELMVILEEGLKQTKYIEGTRVNIVSDAGTDLPHV
jgi:hypothetical protein